MSTIGVYDYDFFNYEHVIPNLDCARLVAYYRQKRHIAVLAPAIQPAKYTKFLIRKEYDDGQYPRELFLPNVEYGGRAFNPDMYKPFAQEVEDTLPDMHIYDRYVDHFGTSRSDIAQIKRILNCAHMRLAPDSQHALDPSYFEPYLTSQGISGIFFHDYDLASLDAFDVIYALQNSRTFKSKIGLRPYPIGNKYPIRVKSETELRKWFDVHVMPNTFFFEYLGYMDDTALYDICQENNRMARQMYYNVTASCSDENDFLINYLPKIYPQALFLRTDRTRILLTYSKEILQTTELQNLIELLNVLISFKWQENFLPLRQTLYTLCRDYKKLQYQNWAFQHIKLSVDQCRDVFQYMREHNYDVFRMFYEWDSILYQGGKFINEWT